MFRYLKAAFFVGVEVPGLGRLPVNAMLAAAFGIFGFAEHAVWLLGIGVESTVLFALTTSERFRKVVDGAQLQSSEVDAETRRRALITTLPSELQRRLIDLVKVCGRVSDLNQQSGDEFVLATNRDALQRLEWVFLKLLVARHNLTSVGQTTSIRELQADIAGIEQTLENPNLTDALRQSKQGTLAILKERLANVERRKLTLDEIDSDLARIEAQAQLLLENASMLGKPATISTDIELACNLAGTNLYGDSGTAIADLDQTFGPKSVSGPTSRTPERQ